LCVLSVRGASRRATPATRTMAFTDGQLTGIWADERSSSCRVFIFLTSS
jgi:hypothetical protein